MKLYNTLGGAKEEFKPLEDKTVRMYVCGPTVYDYDHLGHARTYLAFDLLNRYMRFLGYTVKYVQNITDVGHLQNDAETGLDKVQQKAQESEQTVEQVIEQFTQAHKDDMKALNIVAPDVYPKASEHIKDIIDFVKALVDKGFAYVSSQNNVYFSVTKDSDYGKLSHRGLAEIITGTRVGSASDKRSPADFALWKAAPVTKGSMVWDSPWGRGFPGWHIECSAMSRKYLGDSFDIHGAAIEHVFPHHENEIAQTESLTAKDMAKFWIHSGMLNVSSQKMSKSSHNFTTIREALKTYSANEIRLAFYQTHYRRPFDYSPQSMEQGVALRKKLFTAYGSLPTETDKKILDEIVDALNDDLDTPRALQIWGQEAEKINKADTDKLFEIFGLKYMPIEDDHEASQLAKQRDEARAKNDFLTADNRKNELIARGFEPLDTPSGTRYIPR
ncbi:MAG TPA: cysteine--tRNA ligase [Candidatus Saccharimonadales bacterium]|nr:cysteine--tRNA ligase [Candidatus Saccharimonadales bacterium]